MSDNKSAVFGIYSTRSTAEIAVDALVKAGIPPPNISILLPENPGGPTELGTERGTKASGGYDSRLDRRRRHWWDARVVGGCWPVGHSGPRSFHRSGTDCSRLGGDRCRKCDRWGYRGFDRLGDS